MRVLYEMSKLSDNPSWVEKMRRQFLTLDMNRDGYISSKDVQLFVRSLVNLRSISQEEGREIFKDLMSVWLFGNELDEETSYNWGEFLTLMRKMLSDPVTAKDKVRAYGNALFKIMDTNKNNKITQSELAELIAASNLNFSLDKRVFSFERQDTNHDGSISLEEWLAGLEESLLSESPFG